MSFRTLNTPCRRGFFGSRRLGTPGRCAVPAGFARTCDQSLLTLTYWGSVFLFCLFCVGWLFFFFFSWLVFCLFLVGFITHMWPHYWLFSGFHMVLCALLGKSTQAWKVLGSTKTFLLGPRAPGDFFLNLHHIPLVECFFFFLQESVNITCHNTSTSG